MEQPRQKRWWYRLLQVVYIFCLLQSVVIWVVLVGYSIQARFIVDTNNSHYQSRCDDGSVRGSFTGADLNISNKDFDSELIKEATRFVCFRSDLGQEQAIKSFKEILSARGGYTPVGQRELEKEAWNYIPEEKNYTIEMTEEVYQGSWWYVLIAFVGGLVLIPLIFGLVRAVFLYVVFGESFKKSLLFWHKRKSKHETT